MGSVREELQKYNNQKQLEGTYNSHESRRIGSVQNNGSNITERKSHTSPTHTREQLSRETGVSTANIAKYDVVMKSDNEELNQYSPTW